MFAVLRDQIITMQAFTAPQPDSIQCEKRDGDKILFLYIGKCVVIKRIFPPFARQLCGALLKQQNFIVDRKRIKIADEEMLRRSFFFF